MMMMILCISLFTRSVEEEEQESLEDNARQQYWPESYNTDNTLAPLLYGYPSPTTTPPSYVRVPNPTLVSYSPHIYVPPTTPAPPSPAPYTPPSSYYYSPPTPKPSPVPTTTPLPHTDPSSYITTKSEGSLSQTRTPRRVRCFLY